MSEQLTDVHRPVTYSAVVGNDVAVESVRTMADGPARAFILQGPSGVGKTTVARILAASRQADGPNLLEVDAASRSGVADTRELGRFGQFAPIGGGGKVIIIDEAHRLSKQAWDALLKPIEEPPPYLTWILCTTDLRSIPKTIQTRCTVVKFGLLNYKEMETLLLRVVASENIKIRKRVAEALIDRAGGSPRAMLTALEGIRDMSDDEARMEALDRHVDASPDVIDLCRLLAQEVPYSRLAAQVKKMNLGSADGEGIRRTVLAYFTKVAMGANPPPQALCVLDAFSAPFPQEPGLHHLLLALWAAEGV